MCSDNTRQNNRHALTVAPLTTAKTKYRTWWSSGDGPYFVRLMIGYAIFTAMTVLWPAYRTFIVGDAKVRSRLRFLEFAALAASQSGDFAGFAFCVPFSPLIAASHGAGGVAGFAHASVSPVTYTKRDLGQR